MTMDEEIAALQASVAALTLEIRAVEANSVPQEAADTFWLIFAGTLVFFMQCGFGMLEAGAVASRSTQSIMLKNLFDAALAGVLWWLIGYGITNEDGSFMGLKPLSNSTDSRFATYSLMKDGADVEGVAWADVFFQYTFAAASATIVSGAVAERAQLPAYIVFSSLITGFVYPVVAHWAWSTSGWASYKNPHRAVTLLDFAGSGVVHVTGGLSALAGAATIGPRTGRFDHSGQPVPMPGHSSVLQVLGTFILWLGWYGFNAGSTLSMNTASARIASRVVVITTLAASSGGITSVCLERCVGKTRTWDVAAMCNGILAGLVSITSGCSTVMPWAALIMGSVSACCYQIASVVTLRNRIDDPLDAFAVHGACGYWGLVGCALLARPSYVRDVTRGAVTTGGLLYGDTELFGGALVFIVAHTAWVGMLSTLIFVTLWHLGVLRLPPQAENPTQVLGTAVDTNEDESRHGGQPFGEHCFADAPAVAPDDTTAPDSQPQTNLSTGGVTQVVVEMAIGEGKGRKA